MRNKKIGWFCLIVSGLLEFIWAYFMKLSDGFRILMPSLAVILIIGVGFFLLEYAVQVFGIGMSYSVFTGLGIAGTSVMSFIAFDESISAVKIISIVVLLAGILGLKLIDTKGEDKK